MARTVIEVGGQPVAVAVPEGDRYRFIAVKFPVWSLDGKLFPTPDAARQAAEAVAGARPDAALLAPA